MPVAVGDLRNRFPKVFTASEYNDAELQGAIDEAEEAHGASLETSYRDRLVLYYAAHVAVVGSTQRQAGVQSASAGSVSVTFAPGGPGGESDETMFLARYNELVRRGTLPFAVSRST